MWELYDIRKDFSQAHDLAAENPKKLAEMKEIFLQEAEANKAFPIGAGLWPRIHPEDRVKVPYTSWTFDRFDASHAGIRRARPRAGEQSRRPLKPNSVKTRPASSTRWADFPAA